MSLETWKAEFYPVPADKVSAEDAVAHSLRKWEGLRSDNLQQHGLEHWNRSIGDADGHRLQVDGNSCALCVLYEYEYGEMSSLRCGKCPLRTVRGGYSCDSSTAAERLNSPYTAFISGDSPEPMIVWLKKAKEYEDGRHAGPDSTDAQSAAHAEGHGRASDPRP